MSVDLIVRNARLAGFSEKEPLVDIAVKEGRIVDVASSLQAEGKEENAAGKLVSPPLVETHIHLDKSRILDRCSPSPNRGTDHMLRVSAVKEAFAVEDVYRRAAETIEGCLVHGTSHMRTHVELDPNGGMRGFEALQQLQKDYAWALELELCVFAQEGLTDNPETDANLVEGLKRGATVIGGAPGYDPDHAGQIHRIFELAREFDVDVDIHLDVGQSADELDIWLVCDLAEKYGWQGRTAVGHAAKYSMLPPDQLRHLGRRIADAGVAVTVLPTTDLFVMGRNQDHSVLRGVADGHALGACGVNCTLSTNNVLNPFTPFGDCSLTRMACLYSNIVQRGSLEEMAEAFEMLTRNSAKLMRKHDYGIAVGNPADFVVWNVANAAEAVATIAHPLTAFKRGRRIFTRKPAELHRP
jgi:cytosine/creatinine deaminase